MNRFILKLLLLIAVCVPQLPTQARWYEPNSGRFRTMDSFEGDIAQPLTLHKYVYSENDPVNKFDPSGHKASFGSFDSAEIGKIVHKRIGDNFVATAPRRDIRVTGQSVFTALRLPNPASGGTSSGVIRLFPDLIDVTHKHVYEIKPLSHRGVAGGLVQLTGYLSALNTLDPSGGWGVAMGTEHYNSAQIFMTHKPLAVVTVLPPVLGMIFYEAVTPAQFARRRAMNVVTANSGQLQQQMGIATLLGSMGGL